MRILGGSGGVVNSLDFCPASLKSLGCFYFWCISFSSQSVVKMLLLLVLMFLFLLTGSSMVVGLRWNLTDVWFDEDAKIQLSTLIIIITIIIIIIIIMYIYHALINALSAH